MKTPPKFALLAVFLAVQAVAQPPTITSPASPLGAAPSPDKVVATVDGHDITFAELRTLLTVAPAALAQNPQYAVQQVFMMRYLSGEAEKLKLGDQNPWKEQIEFARMNILAGAMLNTQRESAPVPDGALQAYYNANLSKYQQAKIKVIYIAFKPGVTSTANTPEDLARAAQEALAQAHSSTDRSETQARALAEEVAKKAHAGGDFAALVEQYSEDPASKAAHGDFGVIKRDSTLYPEDLRKAVFALDPGKVSDPVRQPTGFYIIRMEEKSTQPLAEVGTEILQTVRQERLNEWFQDLSKRFKPEIKDPAAFVQSGSNLPNPAQPKP